MSNDLGAFDGSASSKRKVKPLDPVNVMGQGKPKTPNGRATPMAKTKVSTKALTKPIKDSKPVKSSTGQKPMPKKMGKKGC